MRYAAYDDNKMDYNLRFCTAKCVIILFIIITRNTHIHLIVNIVRVQNELFQYYKIRDYILIVFLQYGTLNVQTLR